MAQGGNKGKKSVSLREKKDAANAALAALRKEAGECNSMVSVAALMALDASLLHILHSTFQKKYVVALSPCLYVIGFTSNHMY